MKNDQNAALPFLERARDLLSNMSFEEKAAQMMQLSLDHMSWEEAEMWAVERGIGSFLHAVGEDVCRLQKLARGSRLGIPLLMGIDAIHGHAIHNGCTVFPTALSMACSFSPDLAKRVAQATAAEVAADGLHWVFSPLLCQGRDLRWGRIGETFGEDAHLIGELATAMVQGYQGDSLANEGSVLACLKHFIAYGEASGGRDATDASVTYRRIRETFLPPFVKAIKAGAGSVMTAYQSIDGIPCTVNTKLLNQMLRQELGFDGILTTDWNNMETLVTLQHVAADLKDAAKKALSTTHDVIMSTPGFYDAALALHEEGALPENALDAPVLRILCKKMELGLFDMPEKTPTTLHALSAERMAAHQELAWEAALGSMVLLKNEQGLLPLTHAKTLAIIGPASDSVRAQFGDWTFFTHPTPDETRKPVKHISTFKDGLQTACDEKGIRLIHHKGCDFLGEWEDVRGAVRAAEAADAILCCLGDCLVQTGEVHDRCDLTLSGAQNRLIQELAATGKPVIGLFSGTKPLVLDCMEAASAALICAFSCGQEGGKALADLLFGEKDFTGCLPISFPRATGQMPVYYNQLPGWHTDRYMDCLPTPLFTFGEGLSYTTFAYGALSTAQNDDGVQVFVDVTNSGNRAGTAVVQCYVRDRIASVVQPIRRLVGFVSLFVEPGETRQASFALPLAAFTLVNADEETVLEPGEFEIQVGASSRDEDLVCATICL